MLMLSVSCTKTTPTAPGAADRSGNTKLSGVFVSTDDPKSSIEIMGDHLIMKYEGTSPTDSDVYALAFAESVTENGRTFNNGHYLTLTNTDETLLYEILEWTADKVTLIYLSRGNTLTWVKSRKQQSPDSPQNAIEE